MNEFISRALVSSRFTRTVAQIIKRCKNKNADEWRLAANAKELPSAEVGSSRPQSTFFYVVQWIEWLLETSPQTPKGQCAKDDESFKSSQSRISILYLKFRPRHTHDIFWPRLFFLWPLKNRSPWRSSQTASHSDSTRATGSPKRETAL